MAIPAVSRQTPYVPRSSVEKQVHSLLFGKNSDEELESEMLRHPSVGYLFERIIEQSHSQDRERLFCFALQTRSFLRLRFLLRHLNADQWTYGLETAVQSEDNDMFVALTDSDVIPPGVLDRPLMQIVSQGRIDFLERLLQKRVRISPDTIGKAIVEAAQLKYWNLVASLLRFPRSLEISIECINRCMRIGITCGCETVIHDIFTYLSQSNRFREMEPLSLLNAASRIGAVRKVRELLSSHRFSLPCIGLACQYAIQGGSLDVAQIYINRLYREEGGAKYVETPLELACQLNRLDIVIAIVEPAGFMRLSRNAIARAYEKVTEASHPRIGAVLLKRSPWLKSCPVEGRRRIFEL